MTGSMQAASGLPEGFQIDVSIDAEGWPEEAELKALCVRAFEVAFSIAQLQAVAEAEVSLVFTDDESIRELNDRWRDKNKPTNVLSFPGSDPENEIYGPLLGDIVLACETVRREAVELGIEFSDHVTHLLVHGMLHLFDYDHQEDDEAELMESLERLILAELGIADPYSEKPLTADDD